MDSERVILDEMAESVRAHLHLEFEARQEVIDPIVHFKSEEAILSARHAAKVWRQL